MLDEQELDELRRLVGDYLADRSPESAVRAVMETPGGIDEDLWAGLGAGGLGVCGLAVPSRWGGDGHTFAEVAAVLGELGGSLACVPYFSSVVLAQSLLLASADDGVCARRLPGLASGEVRAAVAIVESDGRWEPSSIGTTATREGDRWRLTGSKAFVVDGHTADLLLVAARTGDAACAGDAGGAGDAAHIGDGLGIFEVEAGAEGLVRTPMTTLDLTRRQARLEMAAIEGRRVGTTGWDAVRRMLEVAAVGLAAESIGGMRRVLDMSVEYAKTRSQFGRPIGSFQAIKHKCADMLVATESADALARDAVRLLSTPPASPARDERAEGEIDDRGVAASLAHAYCQQAYLDCASENIQVHGGIGFTWEHPAQLYYKRAQSSRLLIGDPIFHRARAAELIEL